ncbi:MAG: recombinase family protein [Gammaproteobacteria bacterium]
MRSGNDDNRTSYQEMLDRLRKGRFSGIVSDDTSRHTGNQTELHRLIAPLRNSDRFLVTLNGIDTRSEASELVLSVKAAIDRIEEQKIGRFRNDFTEITDNR